MPCEGMGGRELLACSGGRVRDTTRTRLSRPLGPGPVPLIDHLSSHGSSVATNTVNEGSQLCTQSRRRRGALEDDVAVHSRAPRRAPAQVRLAALTFAYPSCAPGRSLWSDERRADRRPSARQEGERLPAVQHHWRKRGGGLVRGHQAGRRQGRQGAEGRLHHHDLGSRQRSRML